MLDPWIIEEILKREEAERRRKEREGNQPTVPADDPHEDPGPERRDDAPKPGYEMPNRDGGEKPEKDDRGVDTFDIGGDIDIPPAEKKSDASR